LTHQNLISGRSGMYPEGIQSSSPGLVFSANPGNGRTKRFNPEGVASATVKQYSKTDTTLFRVASLVSLLSPRRNPKGCQKVAGGRSPRRPPESRYYDPHPGGVPDLTIDTSRQIRYPPRWEAVWHGHSAGWRRLSPST